MGDLGFFLRPAGLQSHQCYGGLNCVALVSEVVLEDPVGGGPPTAFAEPRAAGERVTLGEHGYEARVFGPRDVAHAVDEAGVAHHRLCKQQIKHLLRYSTNS